MFRIKDLIIGQEVECPDGLGRVTEVNDNFPAEWVRVETYIKNRGCCWAPHNIRVNGKACGENE